MKFSRTLRSFVVVLTIPIAAFNIAMFSFAQEAIDEPPAPDAPALDRSSSVEFSAPGLPDEFSAAATAEDPIVKRPAESTVRQRSSTKTSPFSGRRPVNDDSFNKGGNAIEVDSIMIMWSRKNDKLSGFSKLTGNWTHLAIDRQEHIDPVATGNVGAVRIGNTIAAYSGVTGTWDVVKLKEGSTAIPEVASGDLIKVTDGELLYTFAAPRGRWTSPNASDFRASETKTPNNPQTVTRRSTQQVLTPRNADPASAWQIRHNTQAGPFRADQFDQEALNLARQFRGKGLEDAEAHKALSEAVAVAFDKRQGFQKAEAERMQAKLKTIQQAIESREELRQRIIERRVEELLDPNVNWDTTSTNSKLPAPGALAVDRPIAAAWGMPVTASPTGLPGPPHVPLGGPASMKSSGAPPTAEISPTWRQPTELYKELANRRRFVQMLVERIQDEQVKLMAAQRPLTELKTLKDWEDMTDEDRQRGIDSPAKRIISYQPQLTEFLGQWKQEWSLYESQLKLLQLNVDEAQIRRSAAQVGLEHVRELAESGVITTAEQRKAETELAVAEIAVKRAELHLAPYSAIDKEMTELNPRNFDAEQLLKDPLEEPPSPAQPPVGKIRDAKQSSKSRSGPVLTITGAAIVGRTAPVLHDFAANQICGQHGCLQPVLRSNRRLMPDEGAFQRNLQCLRHPKVAKQPGLPTFMAQRIDDALPENDLTLSLSPTGSWPRVCGNQPTPVVA